MPTRESVRAAFLTAHGWSAAARTPLAGDASFRRYERLSMPDRGAVLMDAPPPQEDVRPFLRVAERLRALGLSVPAILASDPEVGFLLLEDFGDRSYTRLLASDPGNGELETRLYDLAVDALVALHRRFDRPEDLPVYDDERLLAESLLLLDWYVPAVRGEGVSDTARDVYCRLWREAFAQTRRVPSSLVLRDYHVDNLMLLDRRAGVAACGLLDFQDAVIGPVAYDLVSLLEDARRDVRRSLTERQIDRYFKAFPELDRTRFMTSYAILGAQRSAKILGIFTRLDRRDGKPHYLRHIPRVWKWLEGGLAHPALASLRDWFAHELPPPHRQVPTPVAASGTI